MIRTATVDDIPALVEMGRKFHAYSIWQAVDYDAADVARLLEGIIPAGGVFLSEDGMCGGLISPLYFSQKTALAVELFWWAGSNGKALREAFEGWAREHGAAFVQCSALSDDRLPAVSRLYARAGYTPAETAFVKGL